MANDNGPTEKKQGPDATNPEMVDAELKRIELELHELEKKTGELHAQAVMLGSNRSQVTVTVTNGNVMLSGSLGNMVDVLGLLECGKVAFLNMRRQQDEARRAEALAAGQGKTPSGIHLPGTHPFRPPVSGGRGRKR